MQNNVPPSAAIYVPEAMGARALVNDLTALLYDAATGTKRKAIAGSLEQLAVELADNGTDDETLATLWELAARLRHFKHLAQVEAERRADREAIRLRPVRLPQSDDGPTGAAA